MKIKPPIIVPWTRYEFVDLIRDRGYRVGVEVGVDKGFFSYYLLKHSPLDVLYSVDPWAFRGYNDRVAAQAKSMLKRFGDRSQIIRDTSVNAAKLLKAKRQTPVDYGYVDAKHRRRPVITDIATWWPLISSGGCLAGHDYIEAGRCGVIAAVDRFVRRNGLQLYLTAEEGWKSWFVYKP